MSFKTKFYKELKAVFWTSLYFLIWFGSLLGLKLLLLEQYHVDVVGASMVIVGALVAAKSVLILQHVPMPGSKSQSAILSILMRSILYLAGVAIILVLEKSIEARDTYGGVFNAFKNLAHDADRYHIYVNLLCVFGALCIYNLGMVIKSHLGEKSFLQILRLPAPK